MFTVIIFFISNTCIGMYSSLYPPLSTVCVFINLHIESRRLVIFGANVTCIGLEYPVFLNLYVIYRSNMICKWTLHIFGNLIAHWLLASQSASPLMPGLAWGYSLCGSEANRRVNGRMWLLAQGTPRWNKPVKRIRRFLIYIIPTRNFPFQYLYNMYTDYKLNFLTIILTLTSQ